MADKSVMDMFTDMAKQINLPQVDYQPFLDIHRIKGRAFVIYWNSRYLMNRIFDVIR